MFSLEGHINVVYCLAFNNPFGDIVATGSFDKTAKVFFLFIRYGVQQMENYLKPFLDTL